MKFAKETVSVGLDIGTSDIKFAKLKLGSADPELQDFAIEPVSLDIAATLKNMAQAHGISKVNVSVSGQSVIMRYVNFPRMNENELSQALKFEAAKHIPFPPDDVNLDSFILKNDLPDNKMLVLLVAVKKDFLKQRLMAIETAGLKVKMVDTDSVALINMFNMQYPPEAGGSTRVKATALINIGASDTNLNIVENGMPRLSRDIHIAGNNFTRKIADVFNFDIKAAESLKLKPQGDKISSISAAVESAAANLANEIRVSFDYYESQNASSVGRILLTGGGSKFTGLKDMLANLLGIEVEPWDSLKNINIAKNVDPEQLKLVSSSLTVSLGLALH